MRFYFDNSNAPEPPRRSSSINRRKKRPAKTVRSFFLFALASVTFLTLAILLITPDVSSRKVSAEEKSADASNPPEVCAADRAETTKVALKSNETLYSVLESFGLPPIEILDISKAAAGLCDLRRLKEGDVFKVTTVDDEFTRLEFGFSELEAIVVEKGDYDAGSGEKYLASRFEIPHEVVTKAVSGTIESSLYEDGMRAGATPNIIMGLTDVFAWDVDFATEIRKGDSFSVLYESVVTEEGEKIRDKILAAEIISGGEEYSAYYYKDKSGRGDYYNAEGTTLSKALLKSPLRYRRISSYFSKKRFHPILKRYKAHHGVDYAAPTGTPIEAAGDGTVVYAGWKSGYGNFIVIKHNSKYTTAYGHLSRLAKGIRKWAKVKQAQVIGYVGSTGISTGPHLHYEVRVRGKMVNPLTVKSSPRRRLSGGELASFKELRGELASRLIEASEKTVVALGEN